MLHLKKWGGMLGLVALIAVASAASYQFLNSGSKRAISAGEVRISNADAVNKSYPQFYEDLKKLGTTVDLIQP